MERKEAEKLINKLVTARVLVNITNSVVEEVIAELDNHSSEELCEEVLDQIDIRHATEDLEENQKNYEVFKDKIFEALLKSFTINQLKLLEKSNEDSRNYHLMYVQLRDYFTQKVNNAPKYKNQLYFASIHSDKTYQKIFKEMANFTSEFGKNLLNKKNIMDKKTIDEDKIQELFIK